MKLQLPDSIASRQDLKSIILEVRNYARWVSHAGVKSRLAIKTKPEPPLLSAAAVELIKAANGEKPLNQASLDAIIAIFEEFEQSASSLTITLAAPPSNGLKKTLVAWCREHIDPNVLVGFQFNSTLLGGMVIRYGSHVYDWSFRRQILAERGHFTEVLRRV